MAQSAEDFLDSKLTAEEFLDSKASAPAPSLLDRVKQKLAPHVEVAKAMLSQIPFPNVLGGNKATEVVNKPAAYVGEKAQEAISAIPDPQTPSVAANVALGAPKAALSVGADVASTFLEPAQALLALATGGASKAIIPKAESLLERRTLPISTDLAQVTPEELAKVKDTVVKMVFHNPAEVNPADIKKLEDRITESNQGWLGAVTLYANEHGYSQLRAPTGEALDIATGKVVHEGKVIGATGLGEQVPESPIPAPDIPKPIEPRTPPSALDKLQSYITRSGETTLRKMGPSGNELADRLLNVMRDSDIRAGTLKQQVIPDLAKLSPADQEAVVKFLDKGQLTSISNEGRRVAKNIKAILQKQGQELEALSVDPESGGFKVNTSEGPRQFYARQNYYPHQPDVEALRTPEGQAAEIKHLIDTKQVPNQAEAEKVIKAIVSKGDTEFMPEDLRNYGLVAPKKEAGLERARKYDLKNIVRDPVQALSSHFEKVSKRIAEIKQLGQNNDIGTALLAKIANSGGDHEAARAILNRVTGQEVKDHSYSKVLDEVRGFQAFTKLGLASIKNIPQGFVNSYIKSGSFKDSVVGMAKAMTTGGKDFAERIGVIKNKAFEDYIDALTGVVKGEDKGIAQKAGGAMLKATGFKATEEANRVVSANIGKEYIESNLVPKLLKNPQNPLVRRELKSLGLDPESIAAAKGVSADEVARGANTFVRRTQFTADPLALPLFWSTPEGKVLTQFKSFSFNQTKLLKETLKSRPISTPARLAAVASAIGVPVYEVNRFFRRNPRDKQDSLANEILNGFITLGGLGLAGDLFQASKFGKQGALGIMVGPSLSDVADAALASTDAAKGKFSTAGREATRRIPVVGPAIANTEFPRKRR